MYSTFLSPVNRTALFIMNMISEEFSVVGHGANGWFYKRGAWTSTAERTCEHTGRRNEWDKGGDMGSVS